MNYNKLIIPITILLIIAAVAFMAWDFFSDNKQEKNIYEYNIDSFNEVDPNLITHTEVYQFNPDMDMIKSVAINNNDDIYVAGSGKLEIYDSNGDLQNSFTTGINPTCLTIDDNDNIYLGAKDHIEIWNSEGVLKSRWNQVNEKAIITSIAVNDSNVFIADAGNKIVYRFNLESVLLNEIGRKDSISGIQGFVIPSPYFDIAIGRDGELWAVNSGRHQFEAYKPDGRLISSWKKSSMGLDGFSGCCNPSNIALLSDGSFVTSEKGIIRVKIHKPSGEFSSVVAAPNKFEKGTTGIDLAVDSQDRIIVLDPKKGLVSIFQTKENN